ncbi:hypothetical protein [Rhizobium rhizogenes]|nr:hypothetical protein [Rhizobium rhizogenes]NTG65390.1 hypothetical protein [Rhizobium rhizogenes]NTI66254.1 hypothetical protein [Rhizobium rhizogenes]TRB11023.1 hypothetical protein EXN67_15625 [Rhizobium rhizogenes]TRB58688.1 hypothetical protein EXN71_17780 [Rhizobium rhizogenes]
MARGGAVEGFGSKVIPLPHRGAVMACSGFSWVSIVIAGVIASSGSQTFDDLVQSLSDTVRNAIARDKSSSLTFGNFELLIAGHSESRSGPEIHVLCGYRTGGNPPFHMVKLNKFTSPMIGFVNFDHDKPQTSGLSILERQRLTLCGSHDAPSVALYCVGGAAQYAKVSRDGISIKVLKRWPDEVGKPIVTE